MLRRRVATVALASLSLTLVACGKAASTVPPAVAHGLEFIRDDWPRALAEARSRHVPIFVEAWAPW